MWPEGEPWTSPRSVDQRIVELWESRGLYRSAPALDAEVFSAIFPCPNPTGELHLGHALNLTLQDIICRWHRLQGREVLWAGALDHGSFSTQTVVERQMRQRGQHPRETTRAERASAIRRWIDEISSRVYQQIRQFGVMADIGGAASMSDADNAGLTRGYFVELIEKGLLYEDCAVTDWCPGCQTSIDRIDQVQRQVEVTSWGLRYRAVDGSGELEVLTETPETIPGDAALAATANEPGFAGLLGRRFGTALGGPVPLLGAEVVPGGTAIVRVTPGHCRFSERFARTHDLQRAVAYDAGGTIVSGPFAGKPRSQARVEALQALTSAGAILSEQKTRTSRAACRNCGALVEAYATRQWFLALETMLEPTLQLLKAGKVRIHPPRYEEFCRAWLQGCLTARTLRLHQDIGDDWCVSRQIECGTAIPAWRCPEGHLTASEARDACPVCAGATEPVQDVIDMRLGDALWAYCANRRYTQDRSQLAAIGAQAVCVTGLDLLLYWILPIIMLSTKLDDPLPFGQVLIHPMVCDAEGRKMGKSIGNVVVPTEILESQGADCLRLALLDGLDLSGERLFFSREKLERNQDLLQRLIDAARRIALDGGWRPEGAGKALVAELRQSLEAGIRHHDFSGLHAAVRTAIERLGVAAVTLPVLEEILFLLHPFVPITTELLWQRLFPHRGVLAEGADRISRAA